MQPIFEEVAQSLAKAWKCGRTIALVHSLQDRMRSGVQFQAERPRVKASLHT